MQQQHTVIGGGGLRLNVVEWGSLAGPPILLIHGWSQSHLAWLAQAGSELADEFRLVAMDLRGHGLSEAPTDEAAYTDGRLWADDVAAVISALAMDRPVLVGWSYGGLVIVDYLRHHGDAGIAGVNFVGASVQLDEAAIGPLIGPGFHENFADATSRDLKTSVDAMRRFVDRCFAVKLSREDYERVLCSNMTARPDVRASLAAREVDGAGPLGAMRVPALVTHGRLDTIVLPAMAELILERCPTARASWYESCAHAPFVEDRSRFNRELAAFVREARG
ncbi:MAG: alpha/beta fold hydrolase [Gammaproteobacteria bacterium]